MERANDIDRIGVEARLGAHDIVVELPSEGLVRLDAEGRWCSYRRGPDFYRRSLDGDISLIRGSSAISIESSGADTLLDEVLSLLRDVRRISRNDPSTIRVHGEPGSALDVLDRLARGLSWTSSEYAAHVRLFHETYPEPIGVLPPDRYRDVVVLPALGCPHGRCHFCTLFPRGGFEVLRSEAFERHLERVIDFFGDALPTRDGIFLGSASALSLSGTRLIEVLDRVRDVFGPRRRGVAAFHDPDHAPRRTIEDFRELHRAGLRHITVGLESGLPTLREELGKSGDVEAIVGAVRTQRDAGLRSAVTVLVGAGGPNRVEPHVGATVSAIEAMGLGPDDLVFLSPLAGSLSPPRMDEALHVFQTRLRDATAAKVAPYRLECFRYYA